MTPPRLILASASPRRSRLLTEAGIKFIRIPSRAAEDSSFREPELVVRELAYKKALCVALKHPRNPVLGADTIVYCKGRILGKPKNKKDAVRLLNLQNGSWQSVYSGVALIWPAKNFFIAGCDVSKCKAVKLGPDELAEMADKHTDKAGAYAVQDTDDVFIKKIDGRFDTVVGLPMNLVRQFMKRAGLCIK